MKSIFPGDRSGLVRLSIHYTSVLARIYVTPRGFGRNRTAVDSIWCNRHLARNPHVSRPAPASHITLRPDLTDSSGPLLAKSQCPDTVWRTHLDMAPSLNPAWGFLYKPPLTKRHLQWRMLHGAVAVNSFVHHVNSSVGATIAAATDSTDVEVLKVTEGDDVTFCDGLDKNTHAILSCGRVILLNYDEGKIKNPNNNNIKVENGAIIMTDVKRNQSSLIYKLERSIGADVKTPQFFKLDVTERIDSDDSKLTEETKGHHKATYIGLSVSAVIVLLIVAVAVWKRKWIKKKMCGDEGSGRR
ncbi:hypothetical protein WMY93_006262 [Mugilogobius chulae]|uniref:Uncharacterized protein n=1 Tax=Mugilogobius chulae TaxID=88201 RepID=A0AAW0PSZ8_9GOBI